MIDKGKILDCRRGIRKAQQELFDQTIGPVFRLLVRMTGNTDDASDLVQETYLRAFAAIDEFRGQATLKTWLFRIAMNEALQLRRRADMASRHLRIKARRDSRDVQADDAGANRMDVHAALTAIDADDRAILLLRYDQGLNYREIASALDCGEGTVASRLNRARARLRELLGDAYSYREETGLAEHPNGRKAMLSCDSLRFQGK